MRRIDFASMFRTETTDQTTFCYIDPPFECNDPNVSKFSPEVTGRLLLASLCQRLTWPSLAGKKLLDFGCGTRFTRAIINLGMDIGAYAGIDANRELILWLKTNVGDRRFQFEHLNMRNAMYNPQGLAITQAALENLGLRDFDAACMFSVITHNEPEEAETIFHMLHRCVSDNGHLYFTAFVDEAVDGYVERDPVNRGLLSTYEPSLLFEILGRTGWAVSDIYAVSPFQQTAFACRKNRTISTVQAGRKRANAQSGRSVS